MRARLAAGTLLCSLVAPAFARAQAPSPKDEIKAGTLDVSVPASPAFVILDVTPETVVRPASPRGFATQLLNGLDRGGNLQTGVALDTAPFLLWHGKSIDIAKYQSSRAVRFASRIQTSIATTKAGKDAPKGARLGLGLHLTLFDRGDPRVDREFTGKLAAAGDTAIQMNPIPGPGADQAVIDARNAKIVADTEALTKAIRETQAKKTWNASAMVVGLAAAWQSADANVRNFDGDGSAAWVSVAYGFEGVPAFRESAQLIVHARTRRNEATASAQTTDTSIAGVRFRFGGASTNASFDYAWLREKTPAVDVYERLSAGLEHRLAGDIWLQLSIGGERNGGPAAGKLFLLSQFKWALSER